MRREYLVGTVTEMDVVQFKDGKLETARYLLTKLLGEGAEVAAFAVRRIDIPQDNLVLKFPKSAPCLEMKTLNYKFQVHEELYPDHPLRMSPDARLDLLRAEILSYAILDHFIFRFEIYRELIAKTVMLIRRDLRRSFDVGEPLEGELGRASIRPFIDRNMALHLESLIDEGRIEEEDRPFFDRVIAVIRRNIGKWESLGCYMPVSRNLLANLVGLHSEKFINDVELLAIVDSAECAAMITAAHIDGLFKLGTILHYHAQGKYEFYSEVRERQGDEAGSEFQWSRKVHETEVVAVAWQKARDAALIAFRLLEEVAAKQIGVQYYVGIARLWRARTTMIDDKELVKAGLIAMSAMEERLSVEDLHDALLVLSRSMRDVNPQKAENCLGAISVLADYIERRPTPEGCGMANEVRYYLSEFSDLISRENARRGAQGDGE
jgi:hypothetical protein